LCFRGGGGDPDWTTHGAGRGGGGGGGRWETKEKGRGGTGGRKFLPGLVFRLNGGEAPPRFHGIGHPPGFIGTATQGDRHTRNTPRSGPSGQRGSD